MDNILNIDNLELRMLGYYNKEGQFLKEEMQEIELANKLAERLKDSFNEIDDVNNDKDFADAIETGVFILRDKEFNLYAYWHKENVARVTNVVYNKDEIIILPIEYKTWFSPGKEILIKQKEGTTNKSQKTLLEYLELTDKIGKIISLKTDFLDRELLGEIQFIGKDFISIKDKDANTYYVGKHLCIKIHDNVSFEKIVNDDEYNDIPADNNKELHPIGEFSNYDKHDNCWIKNNKGEGLKCQKDEVLIEHNLLKQGNKVVYSIRPNGGIWAVHPAYTISKCLELAQELYNKGKGKAAKEVLNHILNDYPQNEDARDMKEEFESEMKIAQDENLKIKKVFEEAQELAMNPETARMAIEKFGGILKKGKKNKDCILAISNCYVRLIENSDDDEEKNILCQEFYKFLEKEQAKLSLNKSISLRTCYYGKLGMLAEYKRTIDDALLGSQIDDKMRANLLFEKAKLCNKKGEKVKALSYAKESLHLSPFANKAELMEELMEKLDYKIDKPTLVPPVEDFPIEILHLIRYSDCKDKNNPIVIVDYLVKSARKLSQKDGGMKSALYLWSKIFGLIDNFGHFVQFNLAIALSSILNVPINEDETILSAPDWENKKNWKRIIEDCKTFSEKQLQNINYVVRNNKAIVEKLKSFNYNKNTNSKKGLGLPRQDKYSEVVKGASDFLSGIYKDKKTLPEFYEALKKLKYNSSPFCDLEEGDSEILKKLYERCFENIGKFVQEVKFNEKKKLAEEITASLLKIAGQITSYPTEFGVGGILGLVEWLHEQLEKINKTPLEPKISIEIKERNLKEDGDGFYDVSAIAYNAEGSLDATNVLFELFSNDIKTGIGVNAIRSAKFKEGSSLQLQFKIKPIPGMDTKSSLKFDIKYSYFANSKKHFKSLKSQQVYLTNIQFVKIDKNPYFTNVFPGTPTFVGRTEEMNNIIERVLNENTKQIILYGQKRCGKTTLVNAIQTKLSEDYPTETFCVNMELAAASNELCFYKEILSAMEYELDKCKEKSEKVPDFNMPAFDSSEENEENFRRFKECIRDFKKSMQNTAGWEKKKIILILDEFTKLFQYIRSEKISNEILYRWKGLQENYETCFSTIFVGHDVIPALFDQASIRNATSIIEKIQLTYLDRDSARDLIERPIKLPSGESRFDKDAINRIFYYTSYSPWFLHMFMKRMVEHINGRMIVKVTKVDVDDVAKKMLDKYDPQPLADCEFDCLINPGLSDSEYLEKEKKTKEVLKIIALNSVDTVWCKVSLISEKLSLSEKEINEILYDLDTRKVIEFDKNAQIVNIKVGLYKEWLRSN